MGLTAESFARALAQLLPPGAAWRLEPGSTLRSLLLGLADELARVDARGDDLVNEWDPRTTLELLEDWERVLGLPDGCLVTVPDAISERRVLVSHKAIALGGQTPAFYVELAASLGYTVTVEEYRPFRAGDDAGDRCRGTAWAYAWIVHISGALGDLTHFVAGSRAGERLLGFGAIDLECVLSRSAPAHTIPLFAYET